MLGGVTMSMRKVLASILVVGTTSLFPIYSFGAESEINYIQNNLYPAQVKSILLPNDIVLDAGHPLANMANHWKIEFGPSLPNAVFYNDNFQVEIQDLVCTNSLQVRKDCTITIPKERKVCWIMPGDNLQEALENHFRIGCPVSIEFVNKGQ